MNSWGARVVRCIWRGGELGFMTDQVHHWVASRGQTRVKCMGLLGCDRGPSVAFVGCIAGVQGMSAGGVRCSVGSGVWQNGVHEW